MPIIEFNVRVLWSCDVEINDRLMVVVMQSMVRLDSQLAPHVCVRVRVSRTNSTCNRSCNDMMLEPRVEDDPALLSSADLARFLACVSGGG